MLAPRRVVSRDAWEPVGVEALERNALTVVRSEDHRSVIAGPGAGKTELLAQRAAFLLQTGTARPPRRILAISFKRDAAWNLGRRVAERCHPDHAGRLDSLTFDAFAKSLVDRFGQSLPPLWRPSPDYQVAEADRHTFPDFLANVGAPPATVGTWDDIVAINRDRFERDHLAGAPLPEAGWTAPSPAQWAAARFWREALRGGPQSHLMFPMIGRLAELLVRLNPMVRDALRLTYSHLFMDEFQDTTHVQYDLVRSIFLGSDVIVTAVGDNKQQIMRWAMAMDDPFAAFDAAFKATRTPLYNNYRSSPDLVRIQHVLAQALDAKAAAPVSKAKGSVVGDSCEIWDFRTTASEAEELAQYISTQIAKSKLSPRDFVILVRQKPDTYAARLRNAFAAAGLTLRNEAAKVGRVVLQDLLAEEAPVLLIQLLRLATTDRAGRDWTTCRDMLAALNGVGVDDDVAQGQLSRKLDSFVRGLAAKYPKPPADGATASSLIRDIVNFVGLSQLAKAATRYQQGDWLRLLLQATAIHLMTSSKGAADWDAALDSFEGRHAVPLMTIHKSKGLEYHTVVFVGLDDGAWWSFKKDQVEGAAAFFVAFTRAKQRVFFTYCTAGSPRREIADLYGLLAAAGVRTIAKG